MPLPADFGVTVDYIGVFRNLKLARITVLKNALVVIDWRKSQMRRAGVRVAIKAVLRDLPEAYDEAAYEKAVEAVYKHAYESYWGQGKSKYSEG